MTELIINRLRCNYYYSQLLKGVVGAAMIEIMTEAGDDQGQTFDIVEVLTQTPRLRQQRCRSETQEYNGENSYNVVYTCLILRMVRMCS